MSYGKQMQISPHDSAGPWKRFTKKCTVRRMRRRAKRDPENAPVKNSYLDYSN
jgi:hypothetical protein